jgi:hypothetical protein
MPADEDAIINEDASKDDRDVDREGGGRLAWSSEDTRSLMITFGSTLAANIATVMVVGVALVIAHSSRHVATHDLVEWTVLAVVCLPIFTLGLLLRRVMGDSRYSSWLIVTSATIVLIIMILIWLGRAAEVK